MRAVAEIAPATEEENLNRDLATLFSDGENICVTHVLQVATPRGLNRVQRLNSIAQHCRALEFEIRAGSIHG